MGRIYCRVAWIELCKLLELQMEKSSLQIEYSPREVYLNRDVTHFYKLLYNPITESVEAKTVIGV